MIEEKNKKIKPSKLLYASFSANANFNMRSKCIYAFKKQILNEYKVDKFPIAGKLTINQYRSFVDDILEHKFVLCLEGNGLDAHRFYRKYYNLKDFQLFFIIPSLIPLMICKFLF